ncbi:hypothetical protein H0H92_013922 [Tricholoma furcatifolium]|nr:hypothetical protein H0H92_013922 [Tricholoma furcatifolium]
MQETWRPVHLPEGDFSLAGALQQSCADEQENDDLLGLFSSSPLSSVASSRAPSPESFDVNSSAELLASTPVVYPLPEPLSCVQSQGAAKKRKRPSKVAKDKARGKRRRKAARQGDAVRPDLLLKHASAADPIDASAAADALAVASTGFTSLNSKTPPALRRIPVLFKDVSGPGANLRLIKCRDDRPIPFVDASGRVFGVSIAPSHEKTFLESLARITELIEAAREQGSFATGSLEHARGNFPTLSSGYSHGGGRKHPANLNRPCNPNFKLVEDMVAAPAFRRLAGFVDGRFKTWAPKLHAAYAENMAALRAWNPDLCQNWDKSVYTAWVCNLGPQTVCYRHKDAANLPYGLRAITSFGSYDFRRGGHLILWELGIAVECPPWRTAYIPSSPIEHSSTSISPSETRYSTTQYTAGTLFRFADHGMLGAAEFAAKATKEELEAAALRDASRWQLGLSLFSTLEELKASCRK